MQDDKVGRFWRFQIKERRLKVVMNRARQFRDKGVLAGCLPGRALRVPPRRTLASSGTSVLLGGLGGEWRETLLTQSLLHVPSHGWTKASLEAGCQDLGLPPSLLGLLLLQPVDAPEGLPTGRAGEQRRSPRTPHMLLIEHYMNLADRHMCHAVSHEAEEAFRGYLSAGGILSRAFDCLVG
jgi:hypothetical protein